MGGAPKMPAQPEAPPIPEAPLPPPAPPMETSMDVAQERDAQRRKIKKRGGRKETILTSRTNPKQNTLLGQ